VTAFLLSNCRYWLEEFHVDGFRFDGVTSMIYLHRGLGKAFTSYDDYFGDDVDEDAMAYLYLANDVIHRFRPEALTIAEDVSGMPGLAFPQEDGGIGFDCRFSMGVPDYWIRLTKDTVDEDWPMGALWHELTNRRPGERTISYAESHDQAMVGDQTLIFRLIGERMYDSMAADIPNLAVDRGMALHKMIRLLTLFSADAGYLNFMGNEFGHPEWIDFPREGNAWSYKYARRQWRLADDEFLRYRFLRQFDRDMIRLADSSRALDAGAPELIHIHESDKIVAFRRGPLLLAFNFHPDRSFTDYPLGSPPGRWRHVLDTDAAAYGGQQRLAPEQVYGAGSADAEHTSGRIRVYLPARSALVMELAG
jgi:1,4-alpha-glucan branching enzyme